MMNCFEAQKVISKYRGDSIVVPAETCRREWPHISSNPDLDVPARGVMGKASDFALGLALGVPDRKLIVLDADGSLLMNLGALVTIANMAPPNFVHFVFENGVYRTVGGEPIPNAGKFSFSQMANGAGYAHTYELAALPDLESSMPVIMEQAGPTFVCLKVEARSERPPFAPAGTAEVMDVWERFRKALKKGLPGA
jgi:sulfopyruvate decarboxylase subunit beta